MGKNKWKKRKMLYATESKRDAGGAYDVKLTDEQEQRLISDVRREIKRALEMRSPLDAKVDVADALYYQQMPSKTFPFKDACNAHIPIPATIVDTVKSKIKQVFQKRPIYGVNINEEIEEETGSVEDINGKIEDFLDHAIAIDMDAENDLDVLCLNTGKEPMGLLEVYWESDIRTEKKRKSYSTVDDFESDFHNAKKRYPRQYGELSEGRAIEDIEVLEDYDRSGARIAVHSWKNVIYSPGAEMREFFTTIKFIGHRVELNYNELMERVKAGKYGNVDKLFKANDKGGDTSYQFGKYDVWRLIWYSDIDGTGIKKWEIYYAGDIGVDAKKDADIDAIRKENEKSTILRCKQYPYVNGRNNYIPFKFINRPGKVYGQTLIEKSEPLSKLIDSMVRQQVDMNTWANSPVIVSSIASGFDTDLHELYPGASWVLRDVNGVRQLTFGGGNPISLELIGMVTRFLQMLTGVSPETSGQVPQIDPSAPMGKTQILLNEAYGRIGDYISVFKIGLQELAYQILGVYYQFADDEMYQIKDRNGYWFDFKDIKPYFKKRLQISIQGDELNIDPNEELKRDLALLNTILVNFPEIKQLYPQGIRELVTDILKDSRKRNWKKILPSEEEINLWYREQLAQSLIMAKQAEAQKQISDREATEAMKNQGALEAKIGEQVRKGQEMGEIVGQAVSEELLNKLKEGTSGSETVK